MKKIFIIIGLFVGLSAEPALAQNRMAGLEEIVSERLYTYLMEYRPEPFTSDLTWFDSGRWITEQETMEKDVIELLDLVNEHMDKGYSTFLDYNKALELRAKFTIILASLPTNKITLGKAGPRQLGKGTFDSVYQRGIENLAKVFDQSHNATTFNTALFDLKYAITGYREVMRHRFFVGMSAESVMWHGEAQFYSGFQVGLQKEMAQILQDMIQEYHLTDAEIVELVENLGMGEGKFKNLLQRLKLKLDFEPGFRKGFNFNVFDMVTGRINTTLNNLARLTEMPVPWFDDKRGRDPYERVIMDDVAERKGVEGMKARVLKAVADCLKR